MIFVTAKPEGVFHKILKIRDPWNRNVWEGPGSEQDRTFWNRIVMSQ